MLDVTLVTLSHCYTTYNENYLLRKHQDKTNKNNCQYLGGVAVQGEDSTNNHMMDV